MTSDLSSATVTVAGGGLWLAKNCVIILVRNGLKPTSPPTNTASDSPTMMNQRVIRTGRVCGFSPIALPEIWVLVTIFMSCTFCGYPLPPIRQHVAIQMAGNCGFVQSNSAENEIAKLPFEIGSVAVRQAWAGQQPLHRRHHHGAMR